MSTSLELPHHSNEYRQYIISIQKKEISLNYPKSAAMGFFEGTQERVPNSHGKRVISARATEGLLNFIVQRIIGSHTVGLPWQKNMTVFPYTLAVFSEDRTNSFSLL